MQNDRIRRKVEVIKISKEIGVSKTAKLFNISRKSIYNWLKLYNENGKKALLNKSKKHQKHPNLMQTKDFNMIKELKTGNINITIKEIQNTLSKKYSISTIHKKLQEINKINFKYKSKITSLKPFRHFLIIFKQGKQLNIFNKISNYSVIIKDLDSGYEFISIAKEKNLLNLNIYMNYFIFFLKKSNLYTSEIIFYTKNNLFISKESQMKKNFNYNEFKFKHISEYSQTEIFENNKINIVKYVKKILDKENFDLHKKDTVNEQLLIKIFALQISFNSNLIIDDKYFNNKPKAKNKVLFNFKPIVIDLYISKFIQQDQFSENLPITNSNKMYKILQYLFLLSKISENNYKYDDSIKFCNIISDGIKYSTILNNNSMEYLPLLLTTYIQLGINYKKIGANQKSILYLEKAFNLLKNIKIETLNCYDSNQQISLLKNYDILGNNLKNLGILNKAKYCFQKLFDFSFKLNNEEFTLVSYFNFSTLYDKKSNFKESVNSLEKFLCKSPKKFHNIKIKALKKISDYYLDQGFFYKAKKNLLEALDICNDKDAEIKLDLLILLGITYGNLNKFTFSQKYFSQAEIYAEKTKNITSIALCKNNLGNIYLIFGKFRKALENFKDILALLKDNTKNTSFISIVYLNISNVYYSLKEYNTANLYAYKALDVSNNIKNNFLKCQNYILISKILYKQNDFKHASKTARRALDIFNKMKANSLRTKLNDLLLKLEFSTIISSKNKNYYKINKILDKTNQLILLEKKNENKMYLMYRKFWMVLKLITKSIPISNFQIDVDNIKSDLHAYYTKQYEINPKYIYEKILENLSKI